MLCIVDDKIWRARILRRSQSGGGELGAIRRGLSKLAQMKNTNRDHPEGLWKMPREHCLLPHGYFVCLLLLPSYSIGEVYSKSRSDHFGRFGGVRREGGDALRLLLFGGWIER